MEQESANKSASTCLEQNHEQSQFMENGLRFPAASNELLGSSRSKLQGDDTGTSLSSIPPISGEILGQAHNEDLYSIYLKGIVDSRDEQSLPSHNRFEGQGIIGSSHVSVPFGNSLGDSTIVSSTLHCNLSTEALMNSMILGSSTPLRSLGINPIPIPMSSSSSAVMTRGNGISNFANGYTNYESTIDMTSGISSYLAQLPAISRQKRKMVWQDQDNAPNQKRWSNNLIIQGESSSMRSFGSSNERFTLYDRRYEEIGLPLDPHLRIFNATKANGST